MLAVAWRVVDKMLKDQQPSKQTMSALPSTSTDSTSKEAQPTNSGTESQAEDIAVVPDYKQHKKAPARVNIVLDRNTADWLCDSCSNQNFAQLKSGLPRVKCFKCQTPKSASCTLVASSIVASPAAVATIVTTSKQAVLSQNISGNHRTTAAQLSQQPSQSPQVISFKPPPKVILELSNKHTNEDHTKITAKRHATARRHTALSEKRLANRLTPIMLSPQMRRYLEESLGISALMKNEEEQAAIGINNSKNKTQSLQRSLTEVCEAIKSKGIVFADFEDTEQLASMLTIPAQSSCVLKVVDFFCTTGIHRPSHCSFHSLAGGS